VPGKRKPAKGRLGVPTKKKKDQWQAHEPMGGQFFFKRGGKVSGSLRAETEEWGKPQVLVEFKSRFESFRGGRGWAHLRQRNGTTGMD